MVKIIFTDYKKLRNQIYNKINKFKILKVLFLPRNFLHFTNLYCTGYKFYGYMCTSILHMC